MQSMTQTLHSIKKDRINGFIFLQAEVVDEVSSILLKDFNTTNMTSFYSVAIQCTQGMLYEAEASILA